MQVVEIVIRNNTYQISCESEKKDHLLHLASNFNELVRSISQKTGGKGSDALNFLLAALTLEDKVLELTKQLNQEREKHKNEKQAEYNEVLNRVNKIIECVENST
ncbi:cell division protein ZapA [Wolbachia endosymbiont of Ctenocephalides felis wCfeT]|uniref:cell division protein ZapA n=1 Tax=Wolbachia endosymbiont of Ctenocephalides felis wCfeT TaxID=2732593 RepID=UPI0014478F84|nr:cell division protein ZapA [Wolbachia endosymbiont of Ctenocephalides felis wCfeT]